MYLENESESGELVFNFKKLIEVTKTITRNLNKVIDINFYPVPETYRSNSLHRPIGIGVQGLADVFARLWHLILLKQEVKCKFLGNLGFLATCELAKEREDIIQEYIELSENEEVYESMPIMSMKIYYKKCVMIIIFLMRNEKNMGTYSSYSGSLFMDNSSLIRVVKHV